jgi:HNH endonuclease
MKELYACEVADRILHDRQFCNFIAQTVMEIGFDGETVEGLTTQWVEREKWPARVKSILLARDRGKCAACGADIVQELRGEGHIDHMFPIARGGCNDLVNLQLLCSKCNLAKSGQAADVTNSVPEYIRRPRKHAGPAKA